MVVLGLLSRTTSSLQVADNGEGIGRTAAQQRHRRTCGSAPSGSAARFRCRDNHPRGTVVEWPVPTSLAAGRLLLGWPP